MTNIKIPGIRCDQIIATIYLPGELVDRPADCLFTGPRNWRDGDYDCNANQVRKRAKSEGWRRIRVETGRGAEYFDICPSCWPGLESTSKAVQP